MPDVAPARALLRTDLRSIARDPLLLPLLLGTPLLVVVLRFGFPPLAMWAQARFGVDLDAHRGFVLGAFLIIDVPVNAGGLLALAVLDARADRTLVALGVTPLGLGGYVRYRLATGVVLATVLPALALPLTGLLPLSDLARATPALLPAALIAPLAGCVVLRRASNQVEGIAVMKVAAVIWALPLADWFVDRWTPALRLIPTSAALDALWTGLDGGSPWAAAMGGAVWAGLLLTALWPGVRAQLTT